MSWWGQGRQRDRRTGLRRTGGVGESFPSSCPPAILSSSHPPIYRTDHYLPLQSAMAEWITREGGKTRFRYLRPDGTPVRDERTLERIRKHALPAAHTHAHSA